jgi:hypothetical protein
VEEVWEVGFIILASEKEKEEEKEEEEEVENNDQGTISSMDLNVSL